MSTDHEQRLTLANRKMQEQIRDYQQFIRRLLDPEQFGHAVTDEVRKAAADVLAGN